jgi:iron complex transport system ATP-binding protein
MATLSYFTLAPTVDEVVAFGLPPGLSGARGRAAAGRALDAVGMAAMGERIVTSLSGGEQQRVHLARVLAQLAGDPGDTRARFLLLDEPTASLDLAHQLLVLKLAREHAAAGGGVLAVLHDLNLAAMAADEVLAMEAGRVVARGRPDEVITDRLLAEVYGVPLKVRSIPPGVFTLPQTANLAPTYPAT